MGLHNASGVNQLFLQLSANNCRSGSYDYRTLSSFPLYSWPVFVLPMYSTVEFCRSPKKVIALQVIAVSIFKELELKKSMVIYLFYHNIGVLQLP